MVFARFLGGGEIKFGRQLPLSQIPPVATCVVNKESRSTLSMESGQSRQLRMRWWVKLRFQRSPTATVRWAIDVIIPSSSSPCLVAESVTSFLSWAPTASGTCAAAPDKSPGKSSVTSITQWAILITRTWNSALNVADYFDIIPGTLAHPYSSIRRGSR